MPIFDSTVRGRLHDVGMNARRPETIPLLTRVHWVALSLFIQTYGNCSIAQRINVLFIDDTKDMSVDMTRRALYSSEHFLRVPYEYVCVMGYAGISLRTQIELQMLDRRTSLRQKSK